MAERIVLERRKIKSRPERKRRLIICEDTTGGLYYFKDMVKDFKLEKVVDVNYCKSGNDPGNIVKMAKDNKNYYEKIYCVFDRNGHTTYKSALDQCKGNIVAINSVPCFEYWILSHWEYSTKPFVKADSGQSSSEMLERAIRKHCPTFSKTSKNIYEETRNQLNNAIENAKKNAESAKADNRDNPFTRIHELVIDLKSMV